MNYRLKVQVVLHFARLEMTSRVKIFKGGYIRKGGRTQRIKICVDNQWKVKSSLARECKFQNPSDELNWAPVMVKEALGVAERNGLVAVTSLKKGCNITRCTGVIYKDKKIQDTLQEKYRNEGIVGDYMIETEKVLIDATMEGSDAKFANHSCNPNCELVEDHSDPEIVHIVALRKIEKGEEITVNYCIRTDKDDLVPCRCRSKNCRRIKNEPSYELN